MNLSKVIIIEKFQFSTLRKHMFPIYSQMRLLEYEPREFKNSYLKTLIPKFFSRMRVFRGKTIGDIALHAKVTIEQVQAYEEGGILEGPLFLMGSYCEVCSGFHESSYFFELVDEFLTPSVRETRREMALNLWIQFGKRFETVNYSSLAPIKTEIIHFKNPAQSFRQLDS